MPQYPRNIPARRFTYWKSAVCQLGLAALVVLGLLACTQAVSAQSIIITASVAPPGTGAISPSGQVSVTAGGSQTFTASNPQTGYYFKYFQVDGVNQAEGVTSYTFNNVRNPHSIVAVFSKTYTITASVNGGNGTISPAGATPVDYGGSLAIVITPDSGYLVSDVLVDGVSVGPVTLYTFNNISANHTIVATFSQGTHTLTLLFDQSAYQGNVWLQVQDKTQGFSATYGGGTPITFQNSGDIMSVPVPLSAIGTGGLTVSYANGVVLFMFYDDPTNNDRTQAPPQMTSQQRFMPVELTMTGAAGDSGDLTAINYFTAPLGLRSYSVDPTQHPDNWLQQTGFGSATTAQIGALLATASSGNPNAVVKNAQGQIIRYLGPSNDFTVTNPWPSFVPYTQSIYAANQPTQIQNTNSFKFPPPYSAPVYTFGTDNMIATANADGSLNITGRITVSVNGAIRKGTVHNNPDPPASGYWDGATFGFSVSNVNDFNNAIYGQVQNSAVTLTGLAWGQFQDFCQNTWMNPDQPYNATTNPSLNDLFQSPPLQSGGGNAYNTTVNLFIGEVTTGLLGGFLNCGVASNYLPDNGAALKNVPSNHWWLQNPIVGFAGIQPNNPYYNVYANVIFDKSNNTVYGVPYSDRFGTGPVVNAVSYTTNGVSYYVNYWVIGIGAPLPGTKTALPGMLMMMMD
ncbi:MAG: InlB B-repeat-containing protein [Thermodesulfobacteriota bacterium]